MHLPWRWILKKYRANWNKLNDNQLDRSSTSKLHNAKRRPSIRSNLQQSKTKNKMKGFILTLQCKSKLHVVQVFKGMQTLTPPLLIPKLVLFMLLPTLDHLPHLVPWTSSLHHPHTSLNSRTQHLILSTYNISHFTSLGQILHWSTAFNPMNQLPTSLFQNHSQYKLLDFSPALK